MSFPLHDHTSCHGLCQKPDTCQFLSQMVSQKHVSRAEICLSYISYISLQTLGLTTLEQLSKCLLHGSLQLNLWDWSWSLLRVLECVTVAINSLSPVTLGVPFSPPALGSAGAKDVVQVRSLTPNNTAGSQSTGLLRSLAENFRTCPCFPRGQQWGIVSSVCWEVNAPSHMCPEERAVASASPWLCVWSFPMNISVVSSAHELFSPWGGEKASEIEETLLVCTSLALHSHPLKLLASLFSVGIWRGPWTEL